MDFQYNQEYSDYGYLEFEIPPNEQGDFAIEKSAFHIWPRMVCTMLAMANTDKTFTANLYMPLKGKVSFESLSKEEDFVAFMHEYFPDASKHMASTMLNTIRSGPRGRLADIKCYPWHINNFCLVGDAAHAIFPFFG